MKKLIFLIAVLAFAFASQAQRKQPYNQYGGIWKRLQVDSAMKLPTVPLGVKDYGDGLDTAQVYYSPADSSLKVYTGTQWITIGSVTSVPDTAFWRTNGNDFSGYAYDPVFGTIDSTDIRFKTNNTLRLLIEAAGISNDNSDSNYVMVFTPTGKKMRYRAGNTFGQSYTAGPGLLLTGNDFSVLTKRSITIDNDSVMLVNDSTASPASYFYGTNSAGRKGWYSQSALRPYTFTNGLTESGGTVRLGGTLGQNTTLTLDGFNLNIPDFQSFGDTTNWKPVVVNTTGTGGTIGDTRKATYWPGGGGGLGTLDTLPYPPWTVVQDAGGTSYKTAGQRVFNVKDYGATGDGVTDDTRFIQAAINAAHANFGGVVYFPIGHYIIADTLRTTSVPGNPNAQLYIPLSPYSANTDSLRTIEIIGEVAPNYFSDPTADKDNPTTSVILESTLRNTGNLLGASSELFGSVKQMNHTYVKIKNIKFRTDTDSSGVVVGATQTAIDASRLAMFAAEDVVVDVTNSFLSVEPKSTAYGIRMPVSWNYVMSELNRVSVQGMYSGVSLSEHADLSNVFIDACYNGIEFLASDYGAHIDRIIIARCVNAILVSGTTLFTIDDLNVEFKTDNFAPIGAWFNTDYVLKEDAGTTLGDIRSYTVVESGVGLNNSMFNRNTNSSYITAKTSNRVTPIWRTTTRPSLDYGVVGYNVTLSTLEFRDSLQNVWQTVGSNRGVGSVSYNQGTGSGATEELTYDATNNWLNVRSTTASYNTTIGQFPSAPNYGGMWTGNGTPSTSNYSFIGNGGSETVFNVPNSNGSLVFRANNGSSPNIAVMLAGQTGFYNNSPTAKIHIGAGTATASTAPLKFTTGTSLTTPEAGAMEYTTPQLFFTNGGGIRQEIPQIQQTMVTTQFDKTNTSLANVTNLTANLASGKTYRFEAKLYTSSDVAGGVKVAIGGTCTATTIVYEGLTTDAGLITQSRSTALGSAVGAVTAVTAGYITITGSITTDGAGTLTVQFAQNAANGTSSVLWGSTFVVTQINY